MAGCDPATSGTHTDAMAMHGCRLLGCATVLVSLCGCEIGHTMFQMDSNSGRPFFGVDLLPARKKTAQMARPVPATDSSIVTQVRNAPTSSATPVSTIALPKATEPTLLERLKLKRPPERVSLSLPMAGQDSTEGPVEEFR